MESEIKQKYCPLLLNLTVTSALKRLNARLGDLKQLKHYNCTILWFVLAMHHEPSFSVDVPLSQIFALLS